MEDLILRTVVRLFIPFIQMYGLYVLFHGHLSPGGGFSGGTIIGASMILFALTFGTKKGLERIPHDMATILESLGAVWYMGLGLGGILLGANFLANGLAGIKLGIPGEFISGGLIPWITVGIGIKVASTVVSLYYTLVEEAEDEHP